MTEKSRPPLVLLWIREVGDNAALSIGATALALLLVKYANSDGTECRPGDERLCERLGWKPRMLRRYRLELKRAGLLKLMSASAGAGRGREGGTAAVWQLTLLGNTGTPSAAVSGNTGTPSAAVSGNTGTPSAETPALPVPPTFPKTSPYKEQPARKRAGDDDEGFAEFWSTYPQRKDRQAAARAWRVALKRGADPTAIVVAAKRYAEDPRRNPTYTKYPATWLNAESYADEPDETPEEDYASWMQ